MRFFGGKSEKTFTNRYTLCKCGESEEVSDAARGGGKTFNFLINRLLLV